MQYTRRRHTINVDIVERAALDGLWKVEITTSLILSGDWKPKCYSARGNRNQHPDHTPYYASNTDRQRDLGP